jgi:hypothetical protein
MYLNLFVYQKMLSRGYAINLNKDGLLMCLIQLSVLTIEFLKCSHVLETYLLDLPYDLRRALCNFKCLNHRLPIERGHFGGVERDDRVCDICDTGSLGDEYHYLCFKFYLYLPITHFFNLQQTI